MRLIAVDVVFFFIVFGVVVVAAIIIIIVVERWWLNYIEWTILTWMCVSLDVWSWTLHMHIYYYCCYDFVIIFCAFFPLFLEFISFWTTTTTTSMLPFLSGSWSCCAIAIVFDWFWCFFFLVGSLCGCCILHEYFYTCLYVDNEWKLVLFSSFSMHFFFLQFLATQKQSKCLCCYFSLIFWRLEWIFWFQKRNRRRKKKHTEKEKNKCSRNKRCWYFIGCTYRWKKNTAKNVI